MATDPPEVGGPAPTLWDAEPAVKLDPVPKAATVLRSEPSGPDRRRLLWRDSATILIGVVLALLAVQVILPGNGLLPTGSPTPIPTGVAIGSGLPPVSLGPGQTFGPIIDPSLGIDATPTPIPVITMGPPPTPKPSPSPSPKPTASAAPAPKPSKSPPRPSVGPSATPAPPVASFSYNQTGDLTFDFSNTSTTGEVSVSWDFGDSSALDTTSNPTHVFPGPGDYPVLLTATWPGGSDTASHTVHVAPLPTPS
jgi:FOG: PKD repeat